MIRNFRTLKENFNDLRTERTFLGFIDGVMFNVANYFDSTTNRAQNIELINDLSVYMELLSSAIKLNSISLYFGTCEVYYDNTYLYLVEKPFKKSRPRLWRV